MAVIQKTLFVENLDRYNTFVQDTDPNSKYFKITELFDTFTGGKNAFLIQGSQYLVADTLIKIELKDASGNIIYHEPGEGIISSSLNGEEFITEYYEGVSKVVAVYVYPETAYGPCTLTILGELSEYENNGLITPVPLNWQGQYNVKWQKQINVNPSLANTTKIRFYKRPTVAVSELLSPVYRIDTNTGQKINSGINQSFADIKISNLETFAGDVKRIKVFRTSLGDISDYDMIQDILVESKELLTSYALTGSVVGNTGILTSETFKNYWITGSLVATLDSNKVESGAKLKGAGNFIYSASLDLKSTNTYEINLDAFYSASTNSSLGIYIASGSYTSSIATLSGINPTKNLLDTTIPFKLDKDCTPAKLFFSQSQGEWHLGNISLKLSQDTAFSPDEVSFVTTMPTVIGNEDFNFKFEFYDVNNNYVPVAVTQSANFTGGSNAISKLLSFQTDRTAFRFSTGSFANPPNQNVKFTLQKTNFTGSVTYGSSSYDVAGNYIEPSSYAGTYPGWFTTQNDNGALLSIASFSGSVRSVLVGSIVYTASCEGFTEYETIYRFEDGDNAPGVFVTANTNQFIYKATDLSLNPTGQVITIEAKRKNLASATTPLTVNSGSGKPPLTLVSTNATNGVDTYTLAGSSYSYGVGESIYYISGSDQFGNEFSDAIKISPVKILDGFSVAVSNENTSFPAYSIGTVVGGFAASSGSITVKVGNETINYSSAFITNSFSASISAYSGLTPNTFNGTSYSINSLTADSGSLTLLVKYKDGGGTIISSSKDITYSKSKVGTPNVVVAVSPTSQTLVANSKGSGSALPSPLTITALEGNTSRFTSIGTPTYTGGLAGSVSTNTIIFTSNASTMYSDSGSVSIPVNYTDSEGTTGTKTIVANISKAKAAAPTTLALLSSETQTILSSSAGYATPATFTTTITEGSSNYTYDASLASNSTYYISSITGGSNSSGTITPTTPSSTAGTTVSLTISYKNSEGTLGTINKTHKVAVSLEGAKGINGTNGADGGAGPGVVYRGEWANSTIYYKTATRVDVVSYLGSYYLTNVTHTSVTGNATTGQPGVGSNWTSFGAQYSSVATDVLLAQDSTITRGLVMGTLGFYSGFIRSANATSLIAGKGFYLDVDGKVRFGDPSAGYIYFDGTDVNIAGAVKIGAAALIDGTSSSTIKSGAASGATAQQNGSAKTAGSVGGWTITSAAIYSGTEDHDGYTTDGITLYSGGSIHAKQFYIDTSGNAFFKGDITGASGTFSGTVQVGGTNLTAANTLNSNVSSTNVSNALGYTPPSSATVNSASKTAGYVGGWTINSTSIYTGTEDHDGYTTDGITLYGGGSIHAKQFYIDTSGNAFFKGDVTGASGTFSGTVQVGGTNLTAANTLNSNVSSTNVTDALGYTPPTTTQVNDASKTSGYVGGWTINSTSIYTGTEDHSGYTTDGITLYGGGSIHAKQFYIDTSGNAFFKGDVTGASGTFSGNLSGATITGGRFQVGTGDGRIIIDTTDFQTRYEDVTNDRTITIGPGGILLKGNHTDTNESPDSYIYMRQQDDWVRMILTSYKVGISPFEIAGYPQGNSIATIKIYNGGLYAQNYPQNYLDNYNGFGNGGYAIQAIAASSGTPSLYVYGTGEFTGTLTSNTSDKRLKTNIKNIDSPLEKISKINGVYFNWNEKAKELVDKDTEKRDIGFIAQEIQSVLPEIIEPAPFDTELDQENSTAENKIYKSKTGEDYLTIQYEKIVPLLVECIKELKAEIEELKKNK